MRSWGLPVAAGGKDGEVDQEPDGAVDGVAEDGGDDHQGAGGDKEAGGEGVARSLEASRLASVAAPEHEQSRAGEAEPDEVDGDDIAQDLPIGAGKGDGDGGGALPQDRKSTRLNSSH